jgi:hypothetical protein
MLNPDLTRFFSQNASFPAPGRLLLLDEKDTWQLALRLTATGEPAREHKSITAPWPLTNQVRRRGPAWWFKSA